MPTRSHTKLVLALLALAPAAGRAQTDTSLWRFVHPNAKALVSLDWRRMRTSHIGAMVRAKFIDSNPAAEIPGVEFLDDADRFIVSSPGRNSDDTNAEPPLLVVIGGHFDLAKIRNVLATHGVKPQKFNSFLVYRPQGKDARDLAFVLLDAQTILVGDSRSIFASLDRLAFPAPAPAPDSLLARVADMESSYDVWAIIPGSDSLLGDRMTGLLSGQAAGSEAKAFEVGISLRNGLAADVSLAFDDESTAKKMASEFSRIVKLAVKDKMGEPAMVDLEKKLKFAAQGAVAKFTLRLTPQELEKNARIFATSHKEPAASVADIRPAVKPSPAPPLPVPPPPTPAPVPLPAPQPARQVIRIEGLDGGTREIPYKEKQ